MTDRKPYVTPTVTKLGSVHEMTLYFNKVGPVSDVYSATVPIIGSVVSK